MKKLNQLLLISGVVAVPAAIQAANLSDLLPESAVYNGGAINTGNAGHPTAPTPLPVQDLNLGHTMNVEFTPATDDMSGTVVLMEVGGTSNGSGMYLYNGELFYSTKHNSSDNWIADSLNDLSLRPDGSTHGEAAVLSGFGPLSVGAAYTAAVSWDQAGNLQLALQEGTTGGVLDLFTLTGVFGNWQGDRSLSVGQNPRVEAGGVGGSVGGLSGEVPPNNPDAPWNVELDDNTPVLKSLAGTIDNALYWNAAGNLTVVPEPSTLALGTLGALALTLLRRKS